MSAFTAIIMRDLSVARLGGGAGVPLAFYVLIAILLPFGIGADADLLPIVSAGSIWIGALLASLLSLDRLFRADLEDGSLDVLRTAPLPLELIVLAKCAASWITTGAPLTIAAPVLGILHGTSPSSWGALVLSLAVGTPALALLGAVGAALSAGLRSPGLLVPLLVIPISVPVLVFGAAAASGLSTSAFLFTAAISLGALALAPLAAAAALRHGSG